MSEIGSLLDVGRRQAVSAINTTITQTYWQIGKRIVKFEQKGKLKAEYGDYLILRLSKDLSNKYGRGFNLANIKLMRQFYISYTFGYALRSQLNWTQYRTLMRIADNTKRNFYVNYFRENEMMEGENNPIGIVLCTDKDNTFVKYALGGMSNRIFASKYRLSLPSPEDFKKVIEKTRNSCKRESIAKSECFL